MKKLSAVSGSLTLTTTLAFLYFGSIISDFNSNVLSFALGVSFEILITASTILFLIIFIRSKKYCYTILSIIPFVLFLIHLTLTFTIGFQKVYSYGMDVVITILYLIILSRNFEFLISNENK